MRVAVDGDVPQGLRSDRRNKHRLSREEVQFAEEARRPVPDDIVAGGSRIATSPRGSDERVTPVADAVERVAGRALPPRQPGWRVASPTTSDCKLGKE